MLVVQPLVQAYVVNVVDGTAPTGPWLQLQDRWQLFADFVQEELKFEDMGPFLKDADGVCDLAQLAHVLLNDPAAAAASTGLLHPQPSTANHLHHAGSLSHSLTPLLHSQQPSTVGSALAPLSASDRLILLQSASTRLLKQLRRISLQELYAQLSMLPVLLTRFSPSMEDVMQALWQLAEKEFVALCIAGVPEEDAGVADEDGKRLLDFAEFQALMRAADAGIGARMVIKYLP